MRKSSATLHVALVETKGPGGGKRGHPPDEAQTKSRANYAHARSTEVARTGNAHAQSTEVAQTGTMCARYSHARSTEVAQTGKMRTRGTQDMQLPGCRCPPRRAPTGAARRRGKRSDSYRERAPLVLAVLTVNTGLK